jgi:hypothetical protein
MAARSAFDVKDGRAVDQWRVMVDQGKVTVGRDDAVPAGTSQAGVKQDPDATRGQRHSACAAFPVPLRELAPTGAHRQSPAGHQAAQPGHATHCRAEPVHGLRHRRLRTTTLCGG